MPALGPYPYVEVSVLRSALWTPREQNRVSFDIYSSATFEIKLESIVQITRVICAYVKERRTEEEAETILSDAIERLRTTGKP
jgi:hypothetical protein